MQEWKDLFSNSITEINELKKHAPVNTKKLEKVIAHYPFRINPYYLSLIRKKGDAIWKQCIPDDLEIRLRAGRRDPLLEKKYSPVPGMIHRYKDRVLLTVSNMCMAYCRFCTRKRNVGADERVLDSRHKQQALRYIRRHKKVRDVIISGGDPLTLDDAKLEFYLKALRKIPHVEIIRIDSRAPCLLPQRITPGLCSMLKKYAPVYFNTHFNHYQEITKESRRACALLADHGIVMGNQTVLLAGVNDAAPTLKRLFEGLLTMRVRPYYIYIPDAVLGTYHFRVSIAKALRIMRELIGFTSGLAIPHLIVDLKRGGGKTPLLPKYVVRHEGRRYIFKNFEKRIFYYADVR